MAGGAGDTWSNDILKEAFKALHASLVDELNTDDVIHELFPADVLTEHDMEDLQSPSGTRKDKVARLLNLLHRLRKPRTFIELRLALLSHRNNNIYLYLVNDIEKRYGEIEQSKKQYQESELTQAVGMLNLQEQQVKEQQQKIGSSIAASANSSKLLIEQQQQQTGPSVVTPAPIPTGIILY